MKSWLQEKIRKDCNDYDILLNLKHYTNVWTNETWIGNIIQYDVTYYSTIH